MNLALAHLSLSNSLGWHDKETRDDKARTLLSIPFWFAAWLAVIYLTLFLGLDLFANGEAIAIFIGLLSWFPVIAFINTQTRSLQKVKAAEVTYRKLFKFKRFLLNAIVVLSIFLSIPAFIIGATWQHVF
jgi:hypothetical protein